MEYRYHKISDTNEISITGVLGECDNNIVIPEYLEIEGQTLPVTYVCDGFDEFKCKHIIFPNTVKWIDLFENMSVEEVTLPNNENLEISFHGCSALRKVVIPSNIKELSSYAFSDCINLNDLEIQSGDIKFYAKTFQGCSSLKSGLSDYIIKDGMLFSKDFTELCSYLGTTESTEGEDEIIVPASVKVFMNGFGSKYLKFVDLSQTSITEIYADTFSGASNLTKVILPCTIEKIGDRAFLDCERLVDLNWPYSLKEFGIACFSNTNLKSVSLPNGITKIPKSAFLGCKSLQSVYIPNGVKTITNNAFENCDQLRLVQISEGFKSHISDIFKDLSNIQVRYCIEISAYCPKYQGAYTHGRLSCPYCGSNDVSTYVDGTAECNNCGGEYTYWQ